MPPKNVQVCIASKRVNVNLGSAFNLSCTIRTHGKCTWGRNGFFSTDIKRYSTESKWLTNGQICTFKVSEAALIDSGNWTCGIKGDSEHEGVTSEAIHVHVLPKHTGKAKLYLLGS